MDIERDWPAIQAMFRRAFRSSFHNAVATVDPDGSPRLAPIGSLLLTEPGKGIYFDRFTTDTADNLDRDRRIAVLAVDSGKWFWLRSLIRGRFPALPAIRLQGKAGPRRPATEHERERWQRRVRMVRRTRGHEMLWGDLTHVRDLTFEKAEEIDLGPMTAGLD
jgi:hypothetical protein